MNHIQPCIFKCMNCEISSWLKIKNSINHCTLGFSGFFAQMRHRMEQSGNTNNLDLHSDCMHTYAKCQLSNALCSMSQWMKKRIPFQTTHKNYIILRNVNSSGSIPSTEAPTTFKNKIIKMYSSWKEIIQIFMHCLKDQTNVSQKAETRFHINYA